MTKQSTRQSTRHPIQHRTQEAGRPSACRSHPVAIETLESRQLLSALPGDSERLTRHDVERILAAAASQALPTQIIAVVDRNGEVLGVFGMKNAKYKAVKDERGKVNPLIGTAIKAITRARTGGFFASTQDAFTTRTARFIIQDHFPHPVSNTSGGPLYGVQFSSLPFSDFYSGPGISGDPGGIPLFKNGKPVGGIGVAGDGHDVLAKTDLPYDPKVTDPTDPANTYLGSEESDVDEQVALAGASKFMAPEGVQATQILVGGLRLPFTADEPAKANPGKTLDQLISDGDGQLVVADAASVGIDPIAKPYSAQTSATPRGAPDSPFPQATIGGIVGELKNLNPRVFDSTKPNDQNSFGIVGSNERKNHVALPDAQRLTRGDVTRIIAHAVKEALRIRAAIRQPIGVPVKVHVAVVDAHGNVLGAFRMDDGTNFSYDVAIQKARTAAFFSDTKHAFTARAVGFLSQRFFPVGQDGGLTGPMFHLQDALSLSTDFGISNRAATTPGGTQLGNPLRNGITIFPGGAPLYKNGKLVGGVGISGDGVDQDDIIGFAGTKGFAPKAAIRSDVLPESEIVSFLKTRLTQIDTLFNLDKKIFDVDAAKSILDGGLDGVQLPYIKFPRNPDL